MNTGQGMQRLVWVLCVLGIGVSGYLTWTHLAGADPYCGANQSCADVQNSSYAEIAGVPVAVIGLAGYMVLWALSLMRGRVHREVDFYLPVLSFGAALVGVFYSAYLTYVEASVIRAWCLWCVASAIIITALWILSIFDLRRLWSEA
jgi:uncharacterized membrane protein